jgi:hypothetical protein
MFFFQSLELNDCCVSDFVLQAIAQVLSAPVITSLSSYWIHEMTVTVIATAVIATSCSLKADSVRGKNDASQSTRLNHHY